MPGITVQQEVTNLLENSEKLLEESIELKHISTDIEKPTRKVCVGDKVKLIAEDCWSKDDNLKIGDIYTVIQSTGISHKVKGSCYLIDGCQFELVEDENDITPVIDILSVAKLIPIKYEEIVSPGDEVIFFEENKNTKTNGMEVGKTYIVDNVDSDGFIKPVDHIYSYMRSRFSFVNEEKPYPKFDWDNFNSNGCYWIKDQIKELENKGIPAVDNIKNHDFSDEEHEYIDISNFNEQELVRKKDQCLCIINDLGYTEWFRQYAEYVMECIQWQLDK